MSAKNPKVGFVSLGCPKALVDSDSTPPARARATVTRSVVGWGPIGWNRSVTESIW
jgi:hypothetical protein